MRGSTSLAALAACTILWGCATAVPPELIDARLAYQRASEGAAREDASAELQEAERALRRADLAYQQSPRGEEVRDLAYVAKRKVEIAESRARANYNARQRAQAQAELRELETRSAAELADARARLSEQERLEQERLEQAAREAAEQERLAEEERLVAEQAAQSAQLAQAQEELRRRTEELEQQRREIEEERRAREDERLAREQAEARARLALEALDEVAQVEQDARGLVITLPGSLLFPSGRATLGTAAQQRLDKVAEALRQAEGHTVRIEGHTDARGSDQYNQQLSYLRALAVRDYLVRQGVAPERVAAVGFGESRPISEETNAEGRAMNRRVEIVVEPARGVGGAGD